MRHGRAEGGCDCCGANVGGGKMCVWEVSEELVASSFYNQSSLRTMNKISIAKDEKN